MTKHTPATTHSTSGLKSQVLKSTLFIIDLKMMVKSGLDLSLFLKIQQALSEIPANLPFSLSG